MEVEEAYSSSACREVRSALMVVAVREYFHAQRRGRKRFFCLCDCCVVGNGCLGVAGHDANKVRCAVKYVALAG